MMDSPNSPGDLQRAEVAFTFTKPIGMTAKVEVTSRGLLSIGVLVSSILFSTAVLVDVAVRASRRR